MENVSGELKMIKRNKETDYRVIMGSIHQEDLTIANVSVLNIRTPNYMKQK